MQRKIVFILLCTTSECVCVCVRGHGGLIEYLIFLMCISVKATLLEQLAVRMWAALNC